jgi:hypothetical protein
VLGFAPLRENILAVGGAPVRILALFLTGNWKVPLTRRLESLRHVAQTFLSAGSGDFPVARLVTFNVPIQEQCQDAPKSN